MSVDERGQILLPKDLRERAEIKVGEKLAVFTCEEEGRIRGLFLVRAEEFKKTVRERLGPLLEELLR